MVRVCVANPESGCLTSRAGLRITANQWTLQSFYDAPAFAFPAEFVSHKIKIRQLGII